MAEPIDLTEVSEPTCQRCYEERPVTHRIRSEILDIEVCQECALKAMRLQAADPGGLTVYPLKEKEIADRDWFRRVVLPASLEGTRVSWSMRLRRALFGTQGVV